MRVFLKSYPIDLRPDCMMHYLGGVRLFGPWLAVADRILASVLRELLRCFCEFRHS